MSFVAILGRQPKISLAELESVFGASSVRKINSAAAIINDKAVLDQAARLGEIIKIAKILNEVDSTNWDKIMVCLEPTLVKKLPYLTDGKLNFGLSVYGLDVSTGKINASALSLKKIIKNNGRSVRVVPNKDAQLSSAQVLHNKLTSQNGWEILIIKNGPKTILAETQYVQDIDNYAARDQARPARDAQVGMLPPKLAQIIINLSGFQPGNSLLDPFCGTGVVLQEALLAGAKKVYGSDLESRMIEYSDKNLNWLTMNQSSEQIWALKTADATNENWAWADFDTVACETYLGRPLSSAPDDVTLRKIISDCDIIHKKFLLNLAAQTKSGFKLCIAIPAWPQKNRFKSLPALENLSDLGYNRISFEYAEAKDLIYYRSGQQVARELVVLERI